MLRWLFLLLLLVNAVVLLWAALMQRDAVVVAPAPVSQDLSLRLLSELAPAQLKLRAQNPDETGEVAVAQALCVSYRGLGSQAEADQVAVLMRRYGLEPVIEQERIRHADGFELLLNVPDAPDERIALIERLQLLGVVPESRPEEAQLLLGRYDSQLQAEAAAGGFRNTGLAPELQQQERLEDVFTLVIPVDSDRDLFNKINRVLEQSYSDIKIEKKICKGVASP